MLPGRWAGIVRRGFNSDDIAEQAAQALRNVVAVLEAAGAGPEHIVRMTWYVTDKAAYIAGLKEIGQAYRDIIGRWFPRHDCGRSHSPG